MGRFALDLQETLQGQPYLGDFSGYPLQPTDWQKYITAEQALNFSVTGLKPNTVHRAYLNGIDVTNLCKQEGYPLGAGLITPSATNNSSVGLVFVYYF